MEIIPVIDLKEGVVVRARLGLRASYAAIATRLAATSRPADVVAGLLRLYPFRTIYVADLDAIMGRGGNEAVVAALSESFADVTFWVDVGCRTTEEARSWLARHERENLVLGTESLEGPDVLESLCRDPRVLLSLDFDHERFLGSAALLETTEHWPRRIIVMTLARVGSDGGPDLDRLAMIGERAPGANLYAAGGVRDARDLRDLARLGARGVLVASALHDGRLTAEEMTAVAGME